MSIGKIRSKLTNSSEAMERMTVVCDEQQILMQEFRDLHKKVVSQFDIYKDKKVKFKGKGFSSGYIYGFDIDWRNKKLQVIVHNNLSHRGQSRRLELKDITWIEDAE